MHPLTRIYGEEFLRYVLALENGQSLENVDATGGGRGEVLNFLAAQASSLPANDDHGLNTYTNLAGLSSYIPEQGTSLVNFLRTTSGGSLETIDDVGDPVLGHLLAIARDVWPIYLLPLPVATPRTFWLSAPMGIYQHGTLNKLAEAIVSDEDLTKIFPGDNHSTPPFNGLDDLDSYQSIIVDSTGRGGSFQLITLVGFLLSDAVSRSFLRSETLTWDGLCESLPETLEATRLLAKGKAAKLPTIVGISGLRVPDGVSIPIADGLLRAPRQIDRELLLPNADNLTAVYETSFSVRVLHVAEFRPAEADFGVVWGKYNSRIEEAQRAFQRPFDMLRLALLLSSPSSEPLLANETARFTASPLVAGGIQTWSGNRFGITSHELSAAHIKDLNEWHEIVTTKHHSSLDVGLRRLLSATTSRTDPSDAFVDAVIVWENMFGAKAETTFRVTGSVAKLLGPDDPDGRLDLRRELGGLYEKRSRLVHGGKEPSAKELEEFRKRAIEIASECFRKLYRERPDLLPISSEERSARLLIE